MVCRTDKVPPNVGTRVLVYGTYNITTLNDVEPPVYFTLDQVPPTLANVPTLNITDTNQAAPLFDSGVLEDGPHNLTVVSGSSSDGFPVWIDFLEINATRQEIDVFPTTRLARPPGTSAGAIAGIVLGILGFILVATVVGWYVRRRMRQPRNGRELKNFEILPADPGEQFLSAYAARVRD